MRPSNALINTRLVLDTSAVLAYFNGNKAATGSMNCAEVVYLPSVSIGELYFGARKCAYSKESFFSFGLAMRILWKDLLQ